ncbi:MAG: 50S ribosomal protein L3 [SAR324 cluster bacterium]|nr:50S ribosomal protein L3 [SAR324 cluster bacterium]
MLDGMLARKVGMTQIFDETGNAIPVTVLRVGPITVIQKKTEEKEGYNSVQVGFEPISEKKVNRPEKGHFKGIAPLRYLKEFRPDNINEIQIGQTIDMSIFKEGESVAITGISKGKGFTGVMKRYNFGGFPASHGHRGPRAGGSLGQRTTPGKVQKGKKMNGRHGNKTVTITGLNIVRIMPEDHLVLINGPIPGKNGGLVSLYKSNR